MAFKMKGHELPGPNQRKEAPTKWINFVIQGISAIAGAAKKNKEKTDALRQKAKDSMKSGADAAGGGEGGSAGVPDATKIPDATKSKEFKADMAGIKK
jgi:hypothetical protein